jgi:hypothetical protein
MPISCEPSDLAEAAKCFCLSDHTQTAVQTYLLAVIAGGSLDPNVLQEDAKAFRGLSTEKLLDIQAYLLCQIANA